jgi:hypothetical protein
MDSRERDASKYAVGREGIHDDKQTPQPGENRSQESSKEPSSQSEGEGKPDQEGENSSESSAENSAEGEDSQGQNGSSEQGREKGSSSSGGQKSAKSANTPQSSTPPPLVLESVANALTMGAGMLFKLIFYAVLILATLYALWRWWPQVVRFVKDMVRSWRDLLATLFGRRREKRPTVSEDMFQPRVWSFHEFLDPFMTGSAHQYSSKELIRYTFTALEAWARDRGCPRKTDQTANEFAQQVAENARPLSVSVRNLAELYGRAAYSENPISSGAVDQLAELWQLMRATQSLPTTDECAPMHSL